MMAEQERGEQISVGLEHNMRCGWQAGAAQFHSDVASLLGDLLGWPCAEASTHLIFTFSSDPAHDIGGVSLTLQLGKLSFQEGHTACWSQCLDLKSHA